MIVESPSQPITEKKSKGKVASPVVGTPAPQATAAQAQQSGEGLGVPGVGIYTLGQLDLIGGSTITNEAMWTFNKNSVDQAVGILPGVTMTNTGGSRNEKDILVRGFDRFRVPLYEDGVRIYLPYDNRLDFGRFLTPDLSEVQVEKGYVSVLNGPGGEGGAINLVSRKPTKPFELEGRSGVIMSGDLADLNQWSSYAYAGTRQKGYYAQVSGTVPVTAGQRLRVPVTVSTAGGGLTVRAKINGVAVGAPVPVSGTGAEVDVTAPAGCLNQLDLVLVKGTAELRSVDLYLKSNAGSCAHG